MRLTFTTRLTWAYSVLIAAAGAVMITAILLALRLLPDYDFARTVQVEPSQRIRPGGTLPMPNGTGDGPFAISSKDDLLRVVLVISAAALVLVVSLSVLASRLIARRLLRPISKISHAATRAATGNLGYRIAATGPADELTELADTFDNMLTTLQATFQAQQRFTANASHELLTPLAVNRTALQLIRDDPSADLDELHAMLYETNERSIAITQSLLRLAQVRHRPPHIDEVELTALTTDVLRVSSTHDLSVHIDAPPAVTYRGDAALLRHLFSNLIANAVKYNIPGGAIDITIRDLGDHVAQWTISNTGPFVDPALLAHIFEPFHRLTTRQADTSGHGLGLTVADAIVQAHAGIITPHANPAGGITVNIKLGQVGTV